jgi:hypothetical protein
MHRPLARLVRRCVVFLRPGLVLLVDEVRAGAPLRARCLFHYLDRAEAGSEGFLITSGPAQLRGVSLHPAAEHNVIVGREERQVTYHTERGRTQRTNACLYTENLHRSKDLVFVTGLQFGRRPLPEARWTLEGDPLKDGPFTVSVRVRGRTRRLRFDLAAGISNLKVQMQA